MVVGLVASLVSTLVHSSKTKSSSSATANPEDQTTTHHQQGSAHSTPCPRDCSICAVVPSLATRYERKQERKDRRCARRVARRGHCCCPAGIVVQPTASVGGYPTMAGQAYGVRRVSAPRRQEAEGQERGLTDGDVPPPYEQEDTRQALDEKNGRL
ncbi:hypothetical protein VD0004_g1365 [Verticillium dahliae]|uniref:Secreted protein n=1 Tax=Verticillium dahliae TaxID=27337 RepID=A0A444S9X1_VERDA|nr:hypothetical protein VD0004_g1365 [Verticillium dahliae]PNH76078.1 hypothetical protein VD0001_g1529 [Verticillium dahliae]RXG50185.1 hypothetical protein VDGE_01048 [Verticillium dahliae]